VPVQWLVDTILSVAFWVLLIYVVAGWLVAFNVVNMSNRLVAVIYDTTSRLSEPLLQPIRRVIPSLGGVDLSAIVLFIAIAFSRNFLVPLIPF
jgi:YggT family protein